MSDVKTNESAIKSTTIDKFLYPSASIESLDLAGFDFTRKPKSRKISLPPIHTREYDAAKPRRTNIIGENESLANAFVNDPKSKLICQSSF